MVGVSLKFGKTLSRSSLPALLTCFLSVEPALFCPLHLSHQAEGLKECGVVLYYLLSEEVHIVEFVLSFYLYICVFGHSGDA